MRRKIKEVTCRFRLGIEGGLGGSGCGEVRELGANSVDHGQDELFDLVGLNFGFGEELRRAEAEFGHLGL
jgi:hypothetical protein